MKYPLFFLLSSVAATATTQADIVEAEAALRSGNPAQALEALQGVVPCSESHYWRGRALAQIQRYEEAIVELSMVDEKHTLYPYAAKTLIFCARRSKDTEKHLVRLSTSTNTEIATLAKAMLAEHMICCGANVSLAELVSTASSSAEISGALLLLEAEQLRRTGRYDEATIKCREAEEKALPLQREYSRILLAEIHYDQEAASGNSEGKGEETLLKFISSSPDSVLLPEAFRRLDVRGAFSSSKYAIRKLEEWSSDGSKVYRSLLATAIIQREALRTKGQEEFAEIATNRALAIAPDYLPITIQISNTLSRHLIDINKNQEASKYLERVPTNKQDAYCLFYRARTLPPSDPTAMELFLKCAEIAPPPLQEIALCNAMYCAHVSDNTEIIEQILSADRPLAIKRALLLTHAGLNLRKTPKIARKELESVHSMQPNPIQKVEADLQLSQLDIDEQKSDIALNRLSAYTHEERSTWPNEQVMRYYGLFLHALESEQQAGRATLAHKTFLHDALNLSKREDVRIAITLKLSKIYSEEGNHQIALQMLEALAANSKDRDMKARALLLAGRESTQCLTYESVTKGAALFEAASQIEGPYRLRAAILNTAILFRINKIEEAKLRINRIIAEIEKERANTPGDTHLATEYAFALTVKVDIAAIPGTEESLMEAININERLIALPGLTAEWYNRAYLQQAILYSRINKNEKALYYFNLIIKNLPSTAKQSGPDHAYILALSGTGAIACHLKMQEWEAAADIATTIYRHPIAMKYPEHTAIFREWAKQIRKEHCLEEAAFDKWPLMIHSTSKWLKKGKN